jgi:arylsulfatase A-like enzyme
VQRSNHRWRTPPLPLLGVLALGLAGCGQEGSRGAGRPPNIVLISIDGMRADRAHFDRNPRRTTPNLDAFAADGVRFPSAFSQSNESLLSHASLFDGRYPSEIALPNYLEYQLPEQAYTIAEVMRDIGYDTAGFTASGHVRAVFGMNQGFVHWSEQEDFASFFNTVPRALGWLGQRPPDSPPFFMFLHGYDCHRPYGHDSVFFHPFDADYVGPMERMVLSRNATERIYDGVLYPDFFRESVEHAGGVQMSDPHNYLRLADAAAEGAKGIPLSEADIQHMVAHYDGAVLAADTYVGLFLEGLRLLDVWDDTVVVILADHGEDLLTHGFTNHRAVIFDSTTRVPFLMGGGALPEAWRGRVEPGLVDAVDLVPTLTDIAGVSAPAGVRGRSVWALLTGEAQDSKQAVFQQGVLGQSSVRTATHRLVFGGHRLTDEGYHEALALEPIDGGSFQLFHTAQDPDEQRDVLASQRPLAEELRAAMVAWHSDLEQSDEAHPMDPALREELRERGYW